MNFRKEMPGIILLFAVCVLVFATVHRITFEISPQSYPGHWSQYPLMLFLIPAIFSTPVQLILVLASIPETHRKDLLPNLGILVLVVVILVAAIGFIDPMFLLYMT